MAGVGVARVFTAALMGAVQGLTEFLPVSSAAHLLLARRVLRHANVAPGFDVALHAATAAALLVSRRDDLLGSPRSLLRDVARHGAALQRFSPDSLLALRVAAASTPVVLVGALAHARWAAGAPPLTRVAAGLLAGSVLMAVGSSRRRPASGASPAGVSTTQALIIGAAQAAALLPGVSRSGATIATGLALGLDRDTAVRFSFLLAAPAALAAAARTLPALGRSSHDLGAGPMATGLAASFVAGLAASAVLTHAARSVGLMPFVLYRLALALLLLRASRRGSRCDRPGASRY